MLLERLLEPAGRRVHLGLLAVHERAQDRQLGPLAQEPAGVERLLGRGQPPGAAPALREREQALPAPLGVEAVPVPGPVPVPVTVPGAGAAELLEDDLGLRVPAEGHERAREGVDGARVHGGAERAVQLADLRDDDERALGLARLVLVPGHVVERQPQQLAVADLPAADDQVGELHARARPVTAGADRAGQAQRVVQLHPQRGAGVEQLDGLQGVLERPPGLAERGEEHLEDEVGAGLDVAEALVGRALQQLVRAAAALGVAALAAVDLGEDQARAQAGTTSPAASAAASRSRARRATPAGRSARRPRPRPARRTGRPGRRAQG